MEEKSISINRLNSTSTKRKQFPELLYTILELAAVPQGLGKYNNAITWLSHGRAFRILDRDEFEQVIPMFFRATKIRSFQRQLNLWGFKRIRSGVDSGAWYNEWFVRGSPHEMKNMVRVKIKGNANNSTDGSTSSGSGGEDDDNLLDGDPPDFYAMTSQQQPEPGNMKTAMKPCSSSKMEFKSGDQDAIPEHAYLHSNSFLAPGMVSSTPSPAPQKLRRHTTCVEAMPFSSSMHPHSTSDSDLIQQQRRHGTSIGEVLYSSMIYQQSTADLIQQQRRHSMVGEVPSTSMYQQSNHNLPSRMMVPSNHSMTMSDHHRNMPMSVPSAQMAHSSTFRRSRSFEPLPFSNGDDLCQNLSFDNEEEEDPPDEFSQFIDSAIHKTE